MPRIALLPLLVIWFGVGLESKAAVAFLGAIFPIVVNTAAGVQQVDPLWLRAARAFGANSLQLNALVILPGALPGIMAGLRLGVGRALVGVIVGEMYVSIAGVGQLMMLYGNAGRVAELFAVAGLVALFGLACVGGLHWLERRLGSWQSRLEL
jgi:ABC-type nitrate/sulfonate/bicarbonate transport system permease component